MSTAPTFSQLKAMSIDQLQAAYDRLATDTVVGTGFYLDEVSRREALRIEQAALDVARQSHQAAVTVHRLTWIILGATVINAALVAVTLLR